MLQFAMGSRRCTIDQKKRLLSELHRQFMDKTPPTNLVTKKSNRSCLNTLSVSTTSRPSTKKRVVLMVAMTHGVSRITPTWSCCFS